MKSKMLIQVLLVFTFTCLFSLAHAVGVKGSISVAGSYLRPAGENICKGAALNRQQEALINLKKNSEIKCPQGYSIKWGPVCNIYQAIHVASRWPSMTCSLSCFANIKCNQSGKYPIFSSKLVNRNHPKDSDWLRTTATDPTGTFIIIEHQDEEDTEVPFYSSDEWSESLEFED